MPSGILVSGPGKVQNWMRAGAFGHYAIISQTSCKDRRHHIWALKSYSNHKVSEILHYYIHTCRYKAPHSIILLIYKTFTMHRTNLHSFHSNFLLMWCALYRTANCNCNILTGVPLSKTLIFSEALYTNTYTYAYKQQTITYTYNDKTKGYTKIHYTI